MSEAVDSRRPDDPDAPADAVTGDMIDPAVEHGRVGYGKYARYSPAAIGLLIVAALLVIGYVERRPGTEESSVGRLIGAPAPDFALTLFDGQELRLDELRGSVVLLNFWAAWCAPCKAELPRFQALAADAAASGQRLAVVGVGIKRDYGENAQALVDELGLTFPTGRDTAGDDPVRGPIETAYGVSNYPTTIVIAPNGIVSAVHIGEVSAEQLRGYVEGAA